MYYNGKSDYVITVYPAKTSSGGGDKKRLKKDPPS